VHHVPGISVAWEGEVEIENVGLHREEDQQEGGSEEEESNEAGLVEVGVARAEDGVELGFVSVESDDDHH
jgi:hypothetical protein